ncbi:MAG: ABC transporter permease [Verrucomicrobia bacterium RIFCSPLOWO2_12_FULL_64_8]|nr:MAG: ABC transporter permease [Verrucomicrobia bacterium RIFCSPLOWO2_12_FULL_64_8]
MWERIVTILRKEFRSVFRDPRMRMVIFGVPVIQTFIFGYAVTMDVRHVRLVVVDHDRTPASRALLTRFTGSGYFDVAAYTNSEDEARALIDSTEASAILQLNAGFAADLRAGRPAPVQLIVDGSDSNTARLVLNYSAVIVGRHNGELMLEQSQRRAGRVLPAGAVDLRTRAWFNENLESRNYFVPGVMALLVMLISLMLTGMAIVREKEAGTIEQIMVTPIRPVEFILGKCAPFIVIGYVDVLLVTLVGVFWFEIPIRGSVALLLLGTTFYLLSTLGIGLFISTVSGTQQQAMMTTFFFFFPAMLLSGFIYPIANMPVVVQWLTYANPLRYFLIIIRSVFLKGVGFEILWPQLAALLVIGLCVMTFAVTRFRKTL